MKYQKPKIGDEIVIVTRYGQSLVIVKSVGKKYFTAGGHKFSLDHWYDPNAKAYPSEQALLDERECQRWRQAVMAVGWYVNLSPESWREIGRMMGVEIEDGK